MEGLATSPGEGFSATPSAITGGRTTSSKRRSRVARGKFRGGWESTLLPEEGLEDRRRAMNWGRTLLIGHGLILAFSIYFHLWALPLLTSFGGFYGGALTSLCALPQHFGLPDHVSDFRVCSRTFTVHPLVGILYWHMNYHIDHHMYPSVPCYNLGKLHRLIKHDLPPLPPRSHRHLDRAERHHPGPEAGRGLPEDRDGADEGRGLRKREGERDDRNADHAPRALKAAVPKPMR